MRNVQPEGAAISNYVIQAALGLVGIRSSSLFRGLRFAICLNEGGLLVVLAHRIGVGSDWVFRTGFRASDWATFN